MKADVLDINQAAEFLKIPKESLYKYAQKGTVPAMKVGRHWRFSRSLLEQWLQAKSPDARHDAASDAAERAAGTARSVLVVDDDPAVRKLFSKWVASAGHQPLVAASGEEAIHCLYRQAVDLLFLDLYLPDMQGRDVLDRLSGDSRPPVVLVTGAPDSRAMDEALEHDVDYALAKPVWRNEFYRVMERALESDARIPPLGGGG